MRNSAKLAVLVAVGASAAFMGCSSSDDSSTAFGGSSNTGGSAGSHAGTTSTGGTTSSGGTISASGSVGMSGGGSTGVAGGGAGGAAAGSGGASGGTGGAGGASGGTGGASGGTGGAAAGTGGGGGTGGAGVDCAAENVGVGTGAGVTTAVILVDDVQVKIGTTVAPEWQFATGAQIDDSGNGDTPPADKWARVNYVDPARVSGSADAHDTFLDCAGNPAAGSLKNVVPFTAASQYYEVRVVGAPLDLSNAVLTAKVKLVGGGAPLATCPAHALIYAVGTSEATGTPITLSAGKWMDVTLTVPATGFAAVGQIGIRLTTYPCL